MRSFCSLLFAFLIIAAVSLVLLHGLKVLSLATQVFASQLSTLPSPTLNEYPTLTTQIYDREGNLIYDIYANFDRRLVDFDKLPSHVKGAFLASEDQTFYQHQGLSTLGILRALQVNLQNQKLLQGASTITQQLARMRFLTAEKTWERKLKEAVLALQLEAAYSKDEILENFFNNLPLGFNLIGLETGAQVYFGKSAAHLTLAESALLAALTHSPTLLNPYTNRESLNQRSQIILTQMHSAGFIKLATQQAAADQIARVDFRPYAPTLKHPYFAFAVRKFLEQELGPDFSVNSGLKVITTLDPQLQNLAEELVQKYALENTRRFQARDGALLALDPKSGEVLAWVGGVDFARSQVDAITSPRQAGSAAKPLLYLTAFEQGFSPETVVLDEYEDFGLGYRPTNYGDQVSGEWRTIRVALAASLNIPAVRTLRRIGVSNYLTKLQQLGVPVSPESYYGLSLALGTLAVSPFDFAQALQPLANQGLQISLTFIKIKDDYYKETPYNKPSEKAIPPQPAASPSAAAMVNSILSDYATKRQIYGSGTQFKNYTLADRPVAAKTGTSSGPKDTWLVGYTPSLLTAVWVGNIDGSNLAYHADGINAAAPLWHEFMEKALRLKNLPLETFEDYSRGKPKPGFEWIR